MTTPNKARDRLRIAIQKSGRMADVSQDLLARCGLKFRQSRDKLFCFGESMPIDLLLVRDDDIPSLIAQGVCDLGIVGRNVLAEQSLAAVEGTLPVVELCALDNSRCRLSIAVPQDMDYNGPHQLQGLRIATSYPALLGAWLAEHKVEAKIVFLAGSVEIAPKLGTADLICDLVSSGATLVANQLREAVVILESEAVVAGPQTVPPDERGDLRELLLRRIDGVIQVRESKRGARQCRCDPQDAAERADADAAADRRQRASRAAGGVLWRDHLAASRRHETRRREPVARAAGGEDPGMNAVPTTTRLELPVLEWSALDAGARRTALRRPAQEASDDIRNAVARIVAQVRADGDATLRALTRRFDGCELDALQATDAEFAAAEAALDPELKRAITEAKTRIETFHRATAPQTVSVETAPGVVCERVTRPIDSVGLYVPAGSAPLPSTALMLGVPAQIAGCAQVVMCTPADKGGRADAAVLYTAALCGIRKVFKLGGAQAIAAMAFGTESVPACAKLFGPGNAYVTEAKRQVSALAEGPAIDMPAGPSEVLVIADASADRLRTRPA